jgi:hypothetical protein
LGFRVFKSFGDAPDGFSEEVKEVTYAVELNIHTKTPFLCVGYFNESPLKALENSFYGCRL